MPPPQVRRGGIYWVDGNPARGSEQAGRRPGLVVSNEAINRTAPIVVVAALTSRIPRRRYSSHAPAPAIPGTGLTTESVVLCEQLVTVSKDRLGDRLGSLPLAAMARVDQALGVALGFRGRPPQDGSG